MQIVHFDEGNTSEGFSPRTIAVQLPSGRSAMIADTLPPRRMTVVDELLLEAVKAPCRRAEL
jgi:hypothetical protein